MRRSKALTIVALSLILSTPVLAAPVRDTGERQHEPKIVKIIRWLVSSLGDQLGPPKP